MSQIPEFWQKKYRRELGRNWDLFYKRNETRFFRDRHWIAHEFPELLGREMRVFEVGCGVGNFLFPLLELNPLLSVVGCDISPRAVELFKASSPCLFTRPSSPHLTSSHFTTPRL